MKASVWVLAISAIFSSCKDKDEDPTPEPQVAAYTVPTTYNFSAMDFSASTKRITMLGELTTYIRTTHSNTAAPILDAQKMKDMYANVNSMFIDATLNASGVQLKDKTGNAFGLQAELEANFMDAVIASQHAATSPTTTTASNGVAGKLISGTRYILVDTAGFEYKEYIEKGIMGGVLYYQATTILNNISTFNNTTMGGGRTAQESAWDEAFGYFGVPVDFPTNVIGLKNWGSYCNSVSTALGGTTTINATIMNAWIAGRAAISNGDNAARDAARNVVIKTWEKIAAARFITYVKGAKSKIGIETATVNHNLSEGIGFISAFK